MLLKKVLIRYIQILLHFDTGSIPSSHFLRFLGAVPWMARFIWWSLPEDGFVLAFHRDTGILVIILSPGQRKEFNL